MALSQKGKEWLNKIIKLMALFAVLGCIILLIAVYLVSTSLKQVTDMIAPGASSGASDTSTATAGSNGAH